MMMNNSLKSLCKVAPGTVIKGKWHKYEYTVIKELGFGANGIVYLARNANQQVALKMSDNAMSVTSEVNVLKAFAKVQGSALGPSLLDVDDWERSGTKISFYVMEFIKGPDLLHFIHQKGSDWMGVLFLQLLADLADLHKNGWVFGDLKPENLIVSGPPARIRCIDVGGTTLKGRAIKEFTEFFDRGYWGLGSRKADERYDLFAVGMIMLNTAYPKRFTKTTGGIDQLLPMIKQKPELRKFELVINKALSGHYQSAEEMRMELLHVLQPASPKGAPRVKQAPVKTQGSVGSRTKSRQSQVRQRKKSGLFETCLIISAITFIYFLYIYMQLL